MYYSIYYAYRDTIFARMITFLSHQTLVSSQCPHRSNTFEGNIYIHVAAVSIHRLDHPPDCYFTHLQVLPWQWLLVRLHCSLLHMRYMYSKSVLSLFSAMGFFGASYPQQSIDHRIASGKMMKKIPRRGNNGLIVTNATIRRIIAISIDAMRPIVQRIPLPNPMQQQAGKQYSC